MIGPAHGRCSTCPHLPQHAPHGGWEHSRQHQVQSTTAGRAVLFLLNPFRKTSKRHAPPDTLGRKAPSAPRPLALGPPPLAWEGARVGRLEHPNQTPPVPCQSSSTTGRWATLLTHAIGFLSRDTGPVLKKGTVRGTPRRCGSPSRSPADLRVVAAVDRPVSGAPRAGNSRAKSRLARSVLPPASSPSAPHDGLPARVEGGRVAWTHTGQGANLSPGRGDLGSCRLNSPARTPAARWPEKMCSCLRLLPCVCRVGCLAGGSCNDGWMYKTCGAPHNAVVEL